LILKIFSLLLLRMPAEEIPGYIKEPSSPRNVPYSGWVEPPPGLRSPSETPPARNLAEAKKNLLKDPDLGKLKEKGIKSDDTPKKKELKDRLKRFSEPSLKERKELRKKADKVYELAAAWKSISPERKKRMPKLTIDNMKEFTMGLPSGDKLKNAYPPYAKAEQQIVLKLKLSYKRIIRNRDRHNNKDLDRKKAGDVDPDLVDELFNLMKSHQVSPEKFLKKKINGKTVMIPNQ